MDGGYTRSGYSSHNCIIMISNITMIQRMYKTNSRKKIYDFVLDLGGRVEKLRNTTFDFIERNRRIPTFKAIYQRMRKSMQRKIVSQSKQSTKSKIIPSNTFFSSGIIKRKSNSHIPIGEAYIHRRLPEVHLSPANLVALQCAWVPLGQSSAN